MVKKYDKVRLKEEGQQPLSRSWRKVLPIWPILTYPVLIGIRRRFARKTSKRIDI